MSRKKDIVTVKKVILKEMHLMQKYTLKVPAINEFSKCNTLWGSDVLESVIFQFTKVLF